MDPSEIKALAEKGYNAIKDRYNFNGNVIVSALFIPNLSVAVGSKPRGIGVAGELLDTSHRISNKAAHVSEWFQRYWGLIENRECVSNYESESNEDLLHAEDVTIIKGADKYLLQWSMKDWGDRLKFPKGSHMVSYGKYSSQGGTASTVGPKEPCGGTSLTKLFVPRKNVLGGLSITWSV